MVAAVRPADVAAVTEALTAAGETVFAIGQVGEGERGCTVRGSGESWSARSDWSATHNA
jgi:hypothetical protein